MKADRAKVEKLLKTAKGQLDGILRMVEEDRYCIDISNQILAAQAVLNRANKEILKAHMEMCVNRAVETGDSQQKRAEFYGVLEKFLKGPRGRGRRAAPGEVAGSAQSGLTYNI